MGTIQRSNESEEDYSKRKNRVRRTYMSAGGTGSALVHYNPLINYKWSTEVIEDGLTYTKNSGTSKVNALSYGGQGVRFNGVDQSIAVPDIGATSMIYFLDGVQVYTETPFYVLNTVGIWKDVYYFNRVLTSTEQANHISQPNNFYQDALSDVSCVLNIPMCENDSNVKDMVSGTLYPITNYTATARIGANNLTYGSQQTNFYKDSFGVRSGLSPYAEFDGTAYMDTGWVPLASEYTLFEIILEQTNDGFFHLNGTESGEIQIGLHSVANFMRAKIFGSSHDISGVNLGFNHIAITHEADSLAFDVYINGAIMATKTTASTNGTTQFILGMQGGLYMDTPIRLFKVHTEPQDPLELYNDAVSKGLLI